MERHLHTLDEAMALRLQILLHRDIFAGVRRYLHRKGAFKCIMQSLLQTARCSASIRNVNLPLCPSLAIK